MFLKLPLSHFPPSNPAAQWHLKVSSEYEGMQVAPFLQGFSEQGVCTYDSWEEAGKY